MPSQPNSATSDTTSEPFPLVGESETDSRGDRRSQRRCLVTMSVVMLVSFFCRDQLECFQLVSTGIVAFRG
jgi:hypothetical protein